MFELRVHFVDTKSY